MVRFLIIALCLFTGVVAAEAAPGKRVALIVGNSAYQHTAVLRNPRNDAEDVAGALTKLGFEVLTGVDLDKRSMERTIRQFAQQLSGAEVALFFFAGHGLQVSGQNHLVPIDARLSSEGDVDFETIPVHLVLKQMEREAKASLVLLDACRDNPLAKNLARTMGTRAASVGQGLAEVKTGVGTLIGYSTQPGNVALDGAGRNSPYAAAVLKHIETPGQDISAMLTRVRGDVVTVTNGRQVPWEHTSLLGQIIFSEPAPVVPVPGYDREMEMAFWNAVKDSKSPELLQTYLDRFPTGTFSGLARALMDMAEKEKAAQQEVSRRDEELKRAEEAKWAAERKKIETERKTAEAKYAADLQKSQEDARKAREALAIAEREREAARLAAEAARKQQQDETKKAVATVVAALPAPETQKTISPAEESAALARGIQRELQRVGCDPGREDGVWGPSVKAALDRFSRATRTSLAADTPTQEALAAASKMKTRVCPLQCAQGQKEERGRCVAVVEAKPPSARSGANDANSPECAIYRTCATTKYMGSPSACGPAPPGCKVW